MTTKPQAHLHSKAPKPLRKGGLHDVTHTTPSGALTIKGSSPAYAHAREAARIQHTGPVPVRNSTMRGAPYTCPELRAPARAGALDAFRLPSRTCFSDHEE